MWKNPPLQQGSSRHMTRLSKRNSHSWGDLKTHQNGLEKIAIHWKQSVKRFRNKTHLWDPQVLSPSIAPKVKEKLLLLCSNNTSSAHCSSWHTGWWTNIWRAYFWRASTTGCCRRRGGTGHKSSTNFICQTYHVIRWTSTLLHKERTT